MAETFTQKLTNALENLAQLEIVTAVEAVNFAATLDRARCGPIAHRGSDRPRSNSSLSALVSVSSGSPAISFSNRMLVR